MKKNKRAVSITAQTIRNLTGDNLHLAVGGLPTSRDNTCALGNCPPEHLLPGSHDLTCRCPIDPPKPYKIKEIPMKTMTLFLAIALAACAADPTPTQSTSTAVQGEICTTCGGDGEYWGIDDSADATIDWQQTNYPGVPHNNACFFENAALVNCSVHVGTRMVRCWFFLNSDGSLKNFTCEIV